MEIDTSRRSSNILPSEIPDELWSALEKVLAFDETPDDLDEITTPRKTKAKRTSLGSQVSPLPPLQVVTKPKPRYELELTESARGAVDSVLNVGEGLKSGAGSRRPSSSRRVPSSPTAISAPIGPNWSAGPGLLRPLAFDDDSRSDDAASAHEPREAGVLQHDSSDSDIGGLPRSVKAGVKHTTLTPQLLDPHPAAGESTAPGSRPRSASLQKQHSGSGHENLVLPEPPHVAAAAAASAALPRSLAALPDDVSKRTRQQLPQLDNAEHPFEARSPLANTTNRPETSESRSPTRVGPATIPGSPARRRKALKGASSMRSLMSSRSLTRSESGSSTSSRKAKARLHDASVTASQVHTAISHSGITNTNTSPRARRDPPARLNRQPSKPSALSTSPKASRLTARRSSSVMNPRLPVSTDGKATADGDGTATRLDSSGGHTTYQVTLRDMDSDPPRRLAESSSDAAGNNLVESSRSLPASAEAFPPPTPKLMRQNTSRALVRQVSDLRGFIARRNLDTNSSSEDEDESRSDEGDEAEELERPASTRVLTRNVLTRSQSLPLNGRRAGPPSSTELWDANAPPVLGLDVPEPEVWRPPTRSSRSQLLLSLEGIGASFNYGSSALISSRSSRSLLIDSAADRPDSAGQAMSDEELREFAETLPDYEYDEIRQFSGAVYYTGRPSAVQYASPSRYNHGFDDDEGLYRTSLGDHIAYRFEIIGELGAGSFGQVVLVRDHKTGRKLAMKLTRNRKVYAQPAMLEIKIMQYLRRRLMDLPEEVRRNSCLVQIVHAFNFRSHLCITMNPLSISVYDLLKSNDFHGFALVLIRKFAVQLLRALALLTDFGVIHCDVKPENILLVDPKRSALCMIDFGSSCIVGGEQHQYVQSRFYRAPEVLLAMPYTPAIDIWSLACVLVELFTGDVLFEGEDEADQLSLIIEALGVPPVRLIQQSPRRDRYFDPHGAPRPTNNRPLRVPGSRSLAFVLNNTGRPVDPLFVDFTKKCLCWDPAARLTPAQALAHPWITESPPGSATP